MPRVKDAQVTRSRARKQATLDLTQLSGTDSPAKAPASPKPPLPAGPPPGGDHWVATVVWHDVGGRHLVPAVIDTNRAASDEAPVHEDPGTTVAVRARRYQGDSRRAGKTRSSPSLGLR